MVVDGDGCYNPAMIKRFLIYFVAIALAAWLLPGVTVASLWALAATAGVLALINTFIRPVITFFSLPFVILTGGLFLIAINAATIMLASAFVNGFAVSGFLSAAALTGIIFLVWLVLG